MSYYLAGGLVDQVFCANAAILLNNKALIANFAAGPRKPESMIYMDYFTDHGFNTHMTKHKLEGAGDGLFSHGKRKLWLGSGFRSDAGARSEVKDFFQMDDVFTMQLLQDKWYHLDTCFLPLGKEKIICILRNLGSDKKLTVIENLRISLGFPRQFQTFHIFAE